MNLVFQLKYPSDSDFEVIQSLLDSMYSFRKRLESSDDMLIVLPDNYDFHRMSLEELLGLKKQIDKVVEEMIHAKEL